MGLQAFLRRAVLGENSLVSVQEESDWRDEDFFSLLKLAHFERNKLQDPFLKIQAGNTKTVLHKMAPNINSEVG